MIQQVMSQSPEGSADDFHTHWPDRAIITQLLSQSPEGSADDFHSRVSKPPVFNR